MYTALMRTDACFLRRWRNMSVLVSALVRVYDSESSITQGATSWSIVLRSA